MLKMLFNDLKKKTQSLCGLLMQFPTIKSTTPLARTLLLTLLQNFREGVKLVIFLWRSRRINQTFISGIKGEGSSISSLETKLPNKKNRAMSWIWHLQLFPIFQDLRPPYRHVGTGRFGWSHRCSKKSPSHSHKSSSDVCWASPPKKAFPTNLNNKKTRFFVSLPESNGSSAWLDRVTWKKTIQMNQQKSKDNHTFIKV